MPYVSLADWIARVRSGEMGSFPTDTVPAMAVRPDRGDAIYAAKQRSATKPLILMGASLGDLLPYTAGNADEITVWRRVAAQFWPGALTLVLPASDLVPSAMNPQQTGTIGIRVPNHGLAGYLLERTGPLATTSVNRSGQPPLTTVSEIAAQFPQLLTLDAASLAQLGASLNSSPPATGTPSTVARWNGRGWDVLRSGAVALGTTAGLM